VHGFGYFMAHCDPAGVISFLQECADILYHHIISSSYRRP